MAPTIYPLPFPFPSKWGEKKNPYPSPKKNAAPFLGYTRNSSWRHVDCKVSGADTRRLLTSAIKRLAGNNFARDLRCDQPRWRLEVLQLTARHINRRSVSILLRSHGSRPSWPHILRACVKQPKSQCWPSAATTPSLVRSYNASWRRSSLQRRVPPPPQPALMRPSVRQVGPGCRRNTLLERRAPCSSAPPKKGLRLHRRPAEWVELRVASAGDGDGEGSDDLSCEYINNEKTCTSSFAEPLRRPPPPSSAPSAQYSAWLSLDPLLPPLPPIWTPPPWR